MLNLLITKEEIANYHSLTMKVDALDDVKTKTLGRYSFISHLLVSGLNICKNIHGVGELILLLQVAS